MNVQSIRSYDALIFIVYVHFGGVFSNAYLDLVIIINNNLPLHALVVSKLVVEKVWQIYTYFASAITKCLYDGVNGNECFVSLFWPL